MTEYKLKKENGELKAQLKSREQTIVKLNDALISVRNSTVNECIKELAKHNGETWRKVLNALKSASENPINDCKDQSESKEVKPGLPIPRRE